MFAKIFGELKTLLSLRSLKVRFFVIILIVGIIPSIFMRGAIVDNYEERAVEQRIATVQNQLLIVGNHLLNNKYLVTYKSDETVYRNSRAVINAELEMISNLYEGRVMIIDSSLRVVKDTYGISDDKTIISEEVIKCLRGENTSNYDKEHGYIEMTTPIVDSTATDGDGKGSGKIVGVMLTSISNDSIVETMDILNRKSMVIEQLMIVIIVAFAFILSIILTKPFDRVTEAINEIQAGYSDRTISVPDYTETEHIVEAFNQLLKRMKALDDSRQEFVANVSHELKTPMASVIDREYRFNTDLLALVKMDKKVLDLNIASLNINDLVELILKRLRPLARKRDVEVVFESMRPVTAEVDEVKMTLIMTNLVENSIKYNKEHGWVKVELDADHQFFTFRVSDSGLGIPEEELSHIYERFYRVDKSHSREIGGTGLGLAITKSAVLMHRGSITVTSVEGEGSSFTVRIPLTYIAQAVV